MNSLHNIIQFPGSQETSPIPEDLEKQIILGKFHSSTGNVSIKQVIENSLLDEVQYTSTINSLDVDEWSDNVSNEIDLLKQQIKSLEQQFDLKLDSRDKIIDAKFENLSLKIENVQNSILSEIKILNTEMKSQISDSINEYKKDVDAKQKETKTFIWTAAGVVAGIATLIVTVAIPIIQNFYK